MFGFFTTSTPELLDAIRRGQTTWTVTEERTPPAEDDELDPDDVRNDPVPVQPDDPTPEPEPEEKP